MYTSTQPTILMIATVLRIICTAIILLFLTVCCGPIFRYMHSLKVDIKSKLFLVPSVAFYTVNLALYFVRHTECELYELNLHFY